MESSGCNQRIVERGCSPHLFLAGDGECCRLTRRECCRCLPNSKVRATRAAPAPSLDTEVGSRVCMGGSRLLQHSELSPPLASLAPPPPPFRSAAPVGGRRQLKQCGWGAEWKPSHWLLSLGTFYWTRNAEREADQ